MQGLYLGVSRTLTSEGFVFSYGVTDTDKILILGIGLWAHSLPETPEEDNIPFCMQQCRERGGCEEPICS